MSQGDSNSAASARGSSPDAFLQEALGLEEFLRYPCPFMLVWQSVELRPRWAGMSWTSQEGGGSREGRGTLALVGSSSGSLFTISSICKSLQISK